MAWQINTMKNSPNKTPLIGIVIPHTDSFYALFVEKTYGPLRWIQTSWCDKLTMLQYGAPISNSREALVDKALEKDIDYLFFIDTDIIPYDPVDIHQSLYMLYQADAPIVTGLYKAKKEYGWWWALWNKRDDSDAYKPIPKINIPFDKADAAGMGCTLVKREVFENMEKPWFSWETYSEDITFFRKAQESGYDLTVRSDVRFSHIGTFVLTGKQETEFTLPKWER